MNEFQRLTAPAGKGLIMWWHAWLLIARIG